MTDSIIQQSKKSKSWKRPVIIIGILLLLGFGVSQIIKAMGDKEPETKAPEIAEVTKGNIRVSVEGEGKLINPNIVNLSFLINGTLKDVYVEQGDFVKEGDVIANLDQRDLNFDLQDALTQVNIAYANIKSKEAELTDQSIRSAKDDFITAQQSFENNRENYKQSLDQAYDSARVTLKNTFPKMEAALRSIDDIFSVDRQESSFSPVVRAFNDNTKETEIENSYRVIKINRDALKSDFDSFGTVPESEVISFLSRAKSVSQELQNMLEEAMILFDGAVPSSVATQSLIDSAESGVNSSLSSMSSEISTLNSTKQNIEDAQLTYVNGFEDTERSLDNTKLKLENTQRDFERLELTKKNSLAIQYAQLSQTQVKVEKARYNLSLTTLVAPIDGEITVVNGKRGETIKADNASAENAFVRILSEDNFTTEVYIEEVDIARIKKGQTALITLDAIPDVELEGEVSYVSSIATIDNNGVTTYLVRVEILETKDAPVREGMTTYVEFVEHQAIDALLVPTSSVVGDRMIFDENGERIRVRVGVSDGKMTEIYEGVELGQKIMSRPPGDSSRGSGSEAGGRPQGARGGGDMSADERMKMIGERLKENNMLPDGWDGMSTEQKQKALEKMREGQGGGGFGGGATRGGGGRR